MKALITGGGSGIGLAVAQHLLAAGGSVCLFDRCGSDEASAALGGARVLGIDGDVTDEAAVGAAVARMVAELGGIDCVVTSAGMVRVEPALEASLDTFRQTLEVNVLGSFIAARAAVRAMVGSGGGSVVMIGSVYGEGGAPARTAYCASKGAVHNLVRSLAVEWGPLGVRVNAVAPTGTRTPMVRKLIEDGIYNLKGVQARTPLGRLAEPEEVAAAVAFLAGPGASMINGVILPVDGGWTANGFVVS